jgi:alkaline phosphatase D
MRIVLSCIFAVASPLLAAGPFQATGYKVGEVDQNSAVVWTRLTRLERGAQDQVDAAPGALGEVRVTWHPATRSEEWCTPWLPVDPDKDFTRQVELADLTPGTRYAVTVEGRRPEGGEPTTTLTGGFTTAPAADAPATIRMAVVTCQAIRSVESPTKGHFTYKVLDQIRPDLFVHTGDIVYYDKEPLCHDAAAARCKWNRMYAYEWQRAFHLNTTSYFMKDDHDTVKNDCWQGHRYGDLTWEEGLAIFREQVPMREKTYRTVRWGRDLQIWMTENRDFRSPNTDPDGPQKTILGRDQKEWLVRTMTESDATFKVFISPGCVVGPDKEGKNDNHANPAFAHEGAWLRGFLADLGNAIVINGDRHWQYHSVDPETGLHEFGCGPIGNLHDYGGHCGFQPKYHKYFDPGGGFLLVTVTRDVTEPLLRLAHYGADVAPDPIDARRLVRYSTELRPSAFSARSDVGRK